MRFLDRWERGHAVALTAGAAGASVAMLVCIWRQDALAAALAGLFAGDLSVRATIAWRCRS